MKSLFCALAVALLAAPAIAQTGDTPVARRPAPATVTGATPASRPAPRPSAGATAARPAASGATPARRPAAANAPPSAQAVRVPIAALEQSVFGACAQNDLAITRVSGGPVEPRMRVERQMRDGGVRMQRYVYRATGCGRAPRRHNVEVLQHEGLPDAAFALPMGTTAATRLILQSVYGQIFTPMMRERFPGCAPTQLKILDTSIARGTPFTAGGAWTENWRFDACGARGVAELTFAYDGDGVRLTANVPAITPAPAGATPAPRP